MAIELWDTDVLVADLGELGDYPIGKLIKRLYKSDIDMCQTPKRVNYCSCGRLTFSKHTEFHYVCGIVRLVKL